METKTVSVDGRTFQIAKRPGEVHWFEVKPQAARLQHVPASFGAASAPSRPASRPAARPPASRLAAVAESPPATPPASTSWPVGRYDDDVPISPSRPGVQLIGYAIQFGVVSQPLDCGWREIVRPSALLASCRDTQIWIHHDSAFLVDPAARLSCDSYGLRVESRNSARHNRALHACVLKLIAEGRLCGLSVSLNPSQCLFTDYHEQKVREYFHIGALKEISLCSRPQWPGTSLRATDQHHHYRRRHFDSRLHERIRRVID